MASGFLIMNVKLVKTTLPGTGNSKQPSRTISPRYWICCQQAYTNYPIVSCIYSDKDLTSSQGLPEWVTKPSRCRSLKIYIVCRWSVLLRTRFYRAEPSGIRAFRRDNMASIRRIRDTDNNPGETFDFQVWRLFPRVWIQYMPRMQGIIFPSTVSGRVGVRRSH